MTCLSLIGLLDLKQQYLRPLKPYDAPRYLQPPTMTAAALSFVREKVEASCTPDGVGIVRLMGRHAGFIAAHAALASGDVDLGDTSHLRTATHSVTKSQAHLCTRAFNSIMCDR
jgi:hypothetical protein